MSTNPLKAEKQLNFPNDKSYKARMSLDTIIRVEQALGCSILKVGNKLAVGDVTLLECITILTLALRSGGNDLKENDIKELISSIGMIETIKMVGELLSLALSVDEGTTEKKPQAQT